MLDLTYLAIGPWLLSYSIDTYIDWLFKVSIILLMASMVPLRFFFLVRDEESILLKAIEAQTADVSQLKVPKNPLWREPFWSLLFLFVAIIMGSLLQRDWIAVAALVILRAVYQVSLVAKHQRAFEMFVQHITSQHTNG